MQPRFVHVLSNTLQADDELIADEDATRRIEMVFPPANAKSSWIEVCEDPPEQRAPTWRP
jgi:hypothetical protein